MSSNIKRIDIKEFRERGYLQELNRRFLHPLGLALEVIVDDETGEEKLGGVWDCRDDPEGILYADDILKTKEAKQKAARIDNEMKEKFSYRKNKYGFEIQPIKND